MRRLYTLIEGVAGKRHHGEAGHTMRTDGFDLAMHRIGQRRIALHRRAEDRLGHEIVDRQYLKHRIEHGDQVEPVGADDASSMFLRRIVAIDNGDFVAMAHGAQGEQQFGAENGRDADQHCSGSPGKSCRADKEAFGQRQACAAECARVDADRSFAD